MAPSGHHAGKSPGKSPSKSPSSTKSSPKAAHAEAGRALFALLLNSETKDEGEELLDYSFPPDDPELRRIAPMKGVFIASCGVMRAAVGEDAALFVFWAEDGSRQYKASMHRIEKWIVCIVLPGSVSDRTAQFFTDEAAGLIALRHGKLSSVQGHFRQLDRIFRALSSMWSESLQAGDEAGITSSLLYASLGVVPWSSLADSWRAEVRQRICEWEGKWQATAQDNSLAHPEGFALFLGQTLMGTSLADHTFEACLRLCVLEGVLDSSLAPGACRDDASSDVRCHSLFLQRDEEGAAALPSHQYSVLRHGPWLLFMLWQMAAADVPPTGSTPAAGMLEGVSPKTPATALLRGSDPFGVDLCLELLGSLSLPDSHTVKKASSPKPRHTPRSGSSGRESWRSFGLPCPSVFKPGARKGKSGKHQADGDLPPRPAADVQPQQPSFYALELDEPPRASELPAAPRFSSMQRPRCAALDRLSDAAAPLCPEMSPRAAGRRRCEWMPWAPREVVAEWCDLEWLAQVHRRRRASWQDAPSPALSRHVLLSALKTKSEFDRIWDECMEESSLAEPATGRRSEATRLGDGQPWRFQVGAPFLLSDVAPLISAGALTGCGSSKAWSAVSAISSGDKATDATGRRVLLRVEAADGAP